MALPEHFDLTNVREIREQLLAIVNREVLVLVVDMSATVSCDHAGSDAPARLYQRALASGTELRLVVTGELVRRVLSINGVDRLTRLRRAVGELDDILRDARSAVFRAGPAPEEGRLAPLNHHAAHTRR